jgi:uncharacterized damage-inducible protein DinB
MSCLGHRRPAQVCYRGGSTMNELERVLAEDSAAAPAASILGGISEEQVHRKIAGAPRTIYSELWHICFWQQMTLDWIEGLETPYPLNADLPFPSEADIERESWEALCRRFFAGLELAAAATRDAAKLETVVRCPSFGDAPTRTMTVREQLESLAAHSAYHYGRIVLMRQILGIWPTA